MEYSYTNLSINELVSFREKKFLLDLSEYHTQKRFEEKGIEHVPKIFNNKQFIINKINFYSDKLLDGLKREIDSYVQSLTDKNINIYFEYLKKSMVDWDNFSLSKEELSSLINNYNYDEAIRFQNQVNEEEIKYFEKIDSTKKHLETERKINTGLWMIQGFKGNPEYRTVTHYKFYCIEVEHNFIDMEFFDSYYEVNQKMISKFSAIVDNPIRLYNEGKYTSGRPIVEETRLDKWIKRAKNNKVIASVMIVFFVLTSIIGFLTGLQSIYEKFFKANESNNVKVDIPIINNGNNKSDSIKKAIIKIDTLSITNSKLDSNKMGSISKDSKVK